MDPIMLPNILKKSIPVILLAILTIGCADSPNRWTAHNKENGDPMSPKFEAPYSQHKDATREATNAKSQQFPLTPTTTPEVVEGERWNESKDPVLFGIAITGKPGFVLSPYAPDKGLVDVRGFPTGTDVRDPYTWKIMKVPPLPEDQTKAKEQTLKKPEEQAPEVPELSE